MKKPWTPEELTILRTHVLAGLSNRAITGMLPGRSRKAIDNQRKAMFPGVEHRKHTTRVPDDVRDKVLSLYRDGWGSVTNAAKQTGLHRRTIDRIIVACTIAPERLKAGSEPLPPGHPISWGALWG